MSGLLLTPDNLRRQRQSFCRGDGLQGASPGRSSSSSLIRSSAGGCWLPLPSLCRKYSVNWDEPTPPPHEQVIQKPLRWSRSRTCSHTKKADANMAERSAKGGAEKRLRRVPYLHRVQATAAAEREATEVGGSWVPAGGQRRREELSHLGKNLLDHSTVGANTDPLPQLWSHVNHKTLRTGACAAPLRPPGLQLGLQRGQLEEAGLLVQQRELLQRSDKQHNVHSDAVKELHISVDQSRAVMPSLPCRQPQG